jgi:hypothetical protein
MLIKSFKPFAFIDIDDIYLRLKSHYYSPQIMEVYATYLRILLKVNNNKIKSS